MDHNHCSDPLEISEIRCNVLRYLSLKDLINSALVSRSWATDTRRYLWQEVEGYGHNWRRCRISREILEDRAQFIRTLSLNCMTMSLLPVLMTFGSEPLCLKKLEATGFSEGMVDFFFEFVHLVGPSLEELKVNSTIRIANLDQLTQRLGTASRLKKLWIDGLELDDDIDGGAIIADDQDTPIFPHLIDFSTEVIKRIDPNEADLTEAIKFFESFSELTKFAATFEHDDHDDEIWLQVLPSLFKLKELGIYFRKKVLDSELTQVLEATTTGISRLSVQSGQIGVESLGAIGRFEWLESLSLHDERIPGGELPSLLSQCHTLQSLSIGAKVDGTELALGSRWACQDLKEFYIEIVGVSRKMTRVELVEHGVPKEFWMEEPGTHWMLYWKLSLMAKLQNANLRLLDLNGTQHNFGHGSELLRALRNIELIHVDKITQQLSDVEVQLMMDAWPKLKEIELGRCSNGEHVGALFRESGIAARIWRDLNEPFVFVGYFVVISAQKSAGCNKKPFDQ